MRSADADPLDAEAKRSRAALEDRDRSRDARSLAKSVHADVAHRVGQSCPPRPAETSAPNAPTAATPTITSRISRRSTMAYGTLARCLCAVPRFLVDLSGTDRVLIDEKRCGRRRAQIASSLAGDGARAGKITVALSSAPG